MRFSRLRSKGIGSDRVVDVDIEAIPGDIVAVYGPNGAGKSILLECLTGAIDRTLPTRGSIAELAKLSGDRKAYLEVDVTNGQPWRIRHDLDGMSGKGECSVRGSDGREVLDDSKVSVFDEWAAKKFPPSEVRMATTFSAQKAEGFLSMDPGSRRAIILRIAGVEILEKKATRCRKLASEAKGRVDVLEARLQEQGPVNLTEAEHAVGDAHLSLDSAVAKVAAAKATLERVLIEAERVGKLRTAFDAWSREKSHLDVRCGEIQLKLADLNSRIANNEGVLARKDEIRAAVAKAEELAKAFLDAERAGDEAERKRQAAVSAQDAAHAALVASEKHSATHRQRVESAERLLSDRERIEKSVARVGAIRDGIASVETVMTQLEAEVETLTQASQGVAERRIDHLRGALEDVAAQPDDEEDSELGEVAYLVERATDALKDDDATALAASEAPAKLREAKASVESCKANLTRLRRELDWEQKTAAKAAQLEFAQVELDSANEDLRASVAEEETHRAAVAAHLVAQEDHAAARVFAEGAKDTCDRQRKAIEPLLKLADPLTAAEGRLAELTAQRDAARADLDATRAQAETLQADPRSSPPPPAVDLEEARVAVGLAETDHAIATKEVEIAEKDWTEARAKAEKHVALRSDLAKSQEDLADWTRLANDLGKDGLQAMVVDAEGPKLTELANDLLRSCHGPRWSVAIETQKPVDNGKRLAEGCDVRVFDSLTGRDVLGERLSGGELAIVEEACADALTIRSCRNHGVKEPTLVRDETGAALDPESARAYVLMLRRVAKEVNASKVLLVSHSPDVVGLCDARIEVSKDGVSVQV